jgi:hypothetical protein
MPRTIGVFVRIAVRVPKQPLLGPIGVQPTTCWCGDPFCNCRAFDEPPFAPGVTVEMLAFYHEHPDSN